MWLLHRFQVPFLLLVVAALLLVAGGETHEAAAVRGLEMHFESTRFPLSFFISLFRSL